MKKIRLLILLFTCIGCSAREDCSYELDQFDLNAPYSEKINFEGCGDDISYYKLDVQGELDGEISVQNIYKIKAQGKIDTLIRGEFYSNEFNFKYEPKGQVKGKVKFQITLM